MKVLKKLVSFFVLFSSLFSVAQTYEFGIAPCMFNRILPCLHLPGISYKCSHLKGIYHIESSARVPIARDWLCGLHMLYNMCIIENIAKIADIKDKTFINECYKVPQILDERGAYIRDLKKVAKKLVSSPFYVIEYDEDYGVVAIDDHSNEKKFWHKVKKELIKKGPRCVHFGCRLDHIKHDPHVYLISAVKTSDNNIALYVLDNENTFVDFETQQYMAEQILYIYEHLF